MVYFLVVSIAVAIAALIYVCLSWSNPHIVQLMIGSVALGLFIGITSTIIFVFLQERVKESPKSYAVLAFCCLAILIAVLVYSSNAPKNISRKIPVTYIINFKTKEMPLYLATDNEFASTCYMDVRTIVNNFRNASSENKEHFEKILKGTIASESYFRFFQNLTEYLVPFFIGNLFTVTTSELHLYHKELPRRLAIPDKRIKGKHKSLEEIKGEFKKNLFYGTKGLFSEATIEMRLPKNTEMTLERDNTLVSRFTIKNKFVEVKIGIQYLVGGSGALAYLSPSAFLPTQTAQMERQGQGRFKRYHAMIFYDANFTRWRYGFGQMKYYEQWANDLFNSLEEKFGWGSPPLLDSAYTAPFASIKKEPGQ